MGAAAVLYEALPFTVWSLRSHMPYNEYEDLVTQNSAGWAESVAAFHGEPLFKGVGAVVISYCYRPRYVEPGHEAEGQRFDGVVRGPFASVSPITAMFEDVVRCKLKWSPQGSGLVAVPDPYQRIRDAVIQCDNVLVPALELTTSMVPELTVFVSADLGSYPIAVGLWGWRVDTPVVERLMSQ